MSFPAGIGFLLLALAALIFPVLWACMILDWWDKQATSDHPTVKP